MLVVLLLLPAAAACSPSQVLLRFLPRLDASLAVIYQTLGQINDADAKLPLETMPSAPEGETLEQRQERFTESLRSVQRSLLQLEPFLSTPLETDDQPEPQIELLYTPPPWSTPPQTPYFFEVREGDQIVDKIPVNVKGHYLIGRLPICDIVADDATCSRQHAIVQFRPGDPDQFTGQRTDEVYIYDLGSTSGTYVNGMPLQAKAYYPLYKGDILQFGQYACAFVLRDCTDPSIEPPPGLLPETNGTAVVDSGSGGGGLKQQDTTKGDSSAPTATTSASATEARGKLDLLSKPLDPKSADFDQSAYKQAMIERYLQQQKENEEILRKRKEREAQGLPVELDLPYVPERPKRKKTKKGKEDCVVC